jgi:hypothetical protein
MYWIHWLGVWIVMAGSLIVGVIAVTFNPGLGLAVAAAFALVACIAGARVAVVAGSSMLTVRNGWYTRRFSIDDVDRITLQHLPLGGGGRGWDGCLAVWLRGQAEGWPMLATIRFSQERAEDLAAEIVDRIGPRPGYGRIRVQPHDVNRGWRPSSFRARGNRASRVSR